MANTELLLLISLREGFFLIKKKRTVKLSMLYYPYEFPVSHRSVIFSMGTLCVRPWKMPVFSDQYSRSMRGRLFRKRLAAWTCWFQIMFAHTFVPIEEWTYDGNWQKSAYEWNSQFKPYLLSFIHSCVRTFKKKNAVSRLGYEVGYYIFSYLVCSQCIQPKG